MRAVDAALGAFIAIAAIVALIVERPGIAITLAVLMSLGLGLGIWILRRWVHS